MSSIEERCLNLCFSHAPTPCSKDPSSFSLRFCHSDQKPSLYLVRTTKQTCVPLYHMYGALSFHSFGNRAPSSATCQTPVISCTPRPMPVYLDFILPIIRLLFFTTVLNTPISRKNNGALNYIQTDMLLSGKKDIIRSFRTPNGGTFHHSQVLQPKPFGGERGRNIPQSVGPWFFLA